MSGETGLSFPKVVNIVIREGLIRLGKIPESTSQAHLLVDKPFVEEKPKPEPPKAKPESELTTDYSKLSENELLAKYELAAKKGEPQVNMLRIELSRRGYQIKKERGIIQIVKGDFKHEFSEFEK